MAIWTDKHENEMEIANDIRSEIGLAVWLAFAGWRQQGGGRGAALRQVKRLVNEPTVYTLPAGESPHVDAPAVEVCRFHDFETNGGQCFLCKSLAR